MSHDLQYQTLPSVGPGVDHAYGPRVHILSYAYPMALLTRLCHPETNQPQTNQLVSRLFDYLLARVARLHSGLVLLGRCAVRGELLAFCGGAWRVSAATRWLQFAARFHGHRCAAQRGSVAGRHGA